MERDGYFQRWGLLGGSGLLEVCSWGWILSCSPSSSLCLDCHEVSAFSPGHTFPIMKFSLATGLEAMEPADHGLELRDRIKISHKTFALIITNRLVNMTKSISIMACLGFALGV